MKIIEVKCVSGLVLSKLPGLRYCLNPYLGCEHACKYCYVPSMLNNEEALNWGKIIKPKINLPEVLTKEVKRKQKGVVGVSTSTDPYQPLEKKYNLTRKSLEILKKEGFPISIQTKSDLILRDLDLISPNLFDVGVTITTLNQELAEKLEPKASKPDARVQILEECSLRKIQTWLFYGPIIPEINDDYETIISIIKLAKKTKSKIIYDRLNPKNLVLESLKPFLECWNPILFERFLTLVNSEIKWNEIFTKIESLCYKFNVQVEPAFPKKIKLTQYF
ncbi:MAG: radical SAM protein [Candidatus Bathyarchaeia archaeon]|nr:radical SAM protein [Candidatus Bathyarchaeota archaeon]